MLGILEAVRNADSDFDEINAPHLVGSKEGRPNAPLLPKGIPAHIQAHILDLTKRRHPLRMRQKFTSDLKRLLTLWHE
jgi:hypothetical protein